MLQMCEYTRLEASARMASPTASKVDQRTGFYTISEKPAIELEMLVSLSFYLLSALP